MGFGGGKTNERANDALAGFKSPDLDALREQARAARTARRRTFVARLPLPADLGEATGDVQFWSAAIEQIEQQGGDWKLREWSVCPEASGPVAYAVFGA